jgi:glycerate kinase
MKFIFASDSFKGTLSSEKCGKILGECLKNEIQGASFSTYLIADGGEGTLDAFLVDPRAKKVTVKVHDPLLREITASYATIENKAIIALNEASGLTLLNDEERNPLYTSTLGTGELVLDALKNGYRDITLAIGGSATNDGGIGAMHALGIRFLDENKKELLPVGQSLSKIKEIDLTHLVGEVKEASFTVMCDVTNPLLGQNGATYVYGPQKGATPDILKELECGMQNYATIIKETLGIDPNKVVGGGAAGGIGAALNTFLGAKMTSGIETLLDIIDFDSAIKGADYVISGEGRLDNQSLSGKVIYGIANRCKKAGVPLILLVGSLGNGYEGAYDLGVKKIYSLVNDTTPLEDAINQAEAVYTNRATQIFKDINN